MIRVIPSRAAFFLVVLLVVSASPAICTDGKAILRQGESTNEPFDVNGAINFDIPIQNNLSSSMYYTVNLKVGLDKRDYTLVLTETKNLNVKPHSMGKASFTVYLLSPELSRDEFGRWASDENDTSIWERAWYSADIIPLIGEKQKVADYEGHPRLVKAFFEYGNPKVSPKQGNDSTLYNYEVTVFGSYSDNITLEASSDMGGSWKPLGSKEYTTSNSEKTLRWENLTLGFDFNAARYRFKGIRSSQTFDGPFWPVAVEWRNYSLTPGRGLSSTAFAYHLEVNASKPIEVGLNVKDVSSGKYNLVDRKSYANASQWQTLEWKDVRPSEMAGAEGSSNYYFSFFYPGKGAPFQTTYDRDRKYYAGPEIVQVIFRNANVTPANGSALISYSYKVDIETALPGAQVELKTSDPGDNVWQPRGEVLYDGSNNTLSWKDVKLDGEVDGNARYRFVCGQSASDIYWGPRIGSIKINSTVKPHNGSLYITDKTPTGIDDVYSFNYIAEVMSLQSDGSMVISLEVYDPESKSWLIAGSQAWDPGQNWLNYTVNFAKLPFLRPFLGETSYRYTCGGRELNKSRGPNILVNFRNESLQRQPDNNFIYRVEVRSLISPLPVYIIYTDDGVTWQRYSDKQDYIGAGRWQEMSWRARKFQKLEFIADVGQVV